MRLVPSIQKPDFDKEVLTPLRAAQALEKIQADKQAALDVQAARQALEASQQAAIVEQSGAIPMTPPTMAVGVLYGSIGYSSGLGNCVDLAKAYGKNQNGNPDTWMPSTHQPFIGAAALFYFNHVAIVTGVWGNGDIEVAQLNSPGAPHRYSPSEIRGYF